jgi:hypothetical protein
MGSKELKRIVEYHTDRGVVRGHLGLNMRGGFYRPFLLLKFKILII